MATGPTIAGFEGFTQNFYRAKEIAAKEQKEILVVFGRSDTDSATKALSQALSTAKSQLQSFIPVVVDFPQTSEAQGNVQDLATNNAMAQEFGLHRIPALVLLDHQGKSYYFQDKWAQGPTNLATYLEEGAAARKERDQLWTAVKGESLEPAAKFVNWLIDKNLVTRFKDELEKWTPTAKRLDPTNEQGQLEAFVEANFVIEAANVSPTDGTGIKQMVAPLEVWLESQRFKNEDRGVRVHMRAAAYLGRSGQGEAAGKHLVRAGSYNPTDPDLKNALAGAKTLIERGRILSTGTGFIVSEQGYIMTNHHVIGGKGRVVVRLPDGKTTVEGQVIASDADRDMALVKIDIPAGMKAATLSISPSTINRGSNVAAFGYPGARSVEETVSFTGGTVSALPGAATDQMYKLDLRVNPGNSGGPLCDRRGQVVGMVTAKTRTNTLTNEDSYGMAVPATELIKFLDKHLPATAPRAPQSAGEPSPDWSEVDGKVASGVLMILKME
jgi:S1-C subfamily serine protease